MKLLLDQGLARSTAHFLREAGIDAVHVGEIGYTSADDAGIVTKARDQGRAVVTLDADFHALLALSEATSPSVIRIRIEGLRGREAADVIRTVLTECAKDLEQGAVITVQPGRLRVRWLPLLHG